MDGKKRVRGTYLEEAPLASRFDRGHRRRGREDWGVQTAGVSRSSVCVERHDECHDLSLDPGEPAARVTGREDGLAQGFVFNRYSSGVNGLQSQEGKMHVKIILGTVAASLGGIALCFATALAAEEMPRPIRAVPGLGKASQR